MQGIKINPMRPTPVGPTMRLRTMKPWWGPVYPARVAASSNYCLPPFVNDGRGIRSHPPSTATSGNQIGGAFGGTELRLTYVIQQCQ